MSDNNQALLKFHVEGAAPLLPNLAEVLPGSAVLIDALVSEFDSIAVTLPTQQAYWLALNGWITDRLSGPVMDGKASVEQLGELAWAVYASSYWGGMELRENWGMPPVIAKLGIKMAPPFAEVQQDVASRMAQRLEALNGGDDACLRILPTLLRDHSTYGIVHAIGYNAGVQVVKTEEPPIGQRRPHRAPKPAAVRINVRDFMRVDYDLPTPQYLKVWRSAFERAVTANPQGYENAIAGASGQTDLREVWKQAVNYGNTTWGGDAQDVWSDAYFEETVHWSSVLTFGLEAVGLAAFVAIVTQDPNAAKIAVMGNALYIGATSGWLLGLLDTGATLPKIHTHSR
ncbi:MAG: hypothetical protein JWM78_3738 [Verrucomicrobiaceae bacterium]|nr:hypothetical protein [Verrucomicrobiaceae bacterium]